MIGAGVNSDNGVVGNTFISGELFNSNSGVAITIDDSDSVLKLDDGPQDKSQAGKSKSIEQRRGRLQEQLAQQKGALKDQGRGEGSSNARCRRGENRRFPMTFSILRSMGSYAGPGHWRD